MAVWLVCFFVLFALAELFNWVKGFSLPLPISIVAGTFLAVVSNYDKIFGTYFHCTTSTNSVVTSVKLTEIPTSENSVSLPVNTSLTEDIQKSLPESDHIY
ncbi:hypothetical protein H6F32_02530 [Anabaena sp. FACHB-1237]|uniref:hypothetical protein n=1 Tax=Anabaena sp. FACHB-1237 TaxID=2692769 RepID=UPI00168116C4|nr:hypothetical protein [Anabaena sp. FACHB-1237]MBD2136485.1 hypothetical protein [Anabaena sp. FACHB-1237]